MTLVSANRVVFVHAHPDDETITTGSTIAALRAAGTEVLLITATRGEQGEVLVPELKHLEQHRDALGAYRAGELAAACAALDVSQHYYLDDLVDFEIQDSGMQWVADGVAGPAATAPSEALANRHSDLARREAMTAALRTFLTHVDADRVITYDPTGGYGHPDHVVVHELVMTASRPLNICVDWLVSPVESVQDPEVGDWGVDGHKWADLKSAALACHRTQVRLAGDKFALGHDHWWDVGMPERYETAVAPQKHLD